MTATDGWTRLGELLIAARVAKGYTRRSVFARDLGLSHDRTLFDIENAKRQNFDPSTLAFVEQAYGWRPGSIKAVLAGGEPIVTRQNSGREVQVNGGSVGGYEKGREPYLSRREGPDLSDVSTDALLEEIAKRARSNNPDATR